MKKLLLFALPLLFCFTLSAQITQEEADDIVREHLIAATGDFTVYAKEDVQTNFVVLTATNEKLKLNYPCWVYYVNFTDETNSKYLIVKESNGNVLEVNAWNDEGPDGLEDWRAVVIYPMEVPFTEYSLSETMCVWKQFIYPIITIINSMEELETHISCAVDSFPEIDFSQNSLVLLRESWANPFDFGTITFTQFSKNRFKLNVEMLVYNHTTCTDDQVFSFITKKLNDESIIERHWQRIFTSTQLKNINFPSESELVVVNSMEEFEYYFEYPEGNTPEIDFSQHTLLMPNGYRNNIEHVYDCQFIKQGENEYKLAVKLIGGQPAFSQWILKLLISKLPPNTVISLNVSN